MEGQALVEDGGNVTVVVKKEARLRERVEIPLNLPTLSTLNLRRCKVVPHMTELKHTALSFKGKLSAGAKLRVWHPTASVKPVEIR